MAVLLARIGADVVVTQKAGADDPAPPRRPGAGVAGFAVLTVDVAALVPSWSVTAARLFGRTAGEMTGQHLGDVLLNRPGQRELLQQALAEAGAGRPWTATVHLAFAGTDGPATVHCEPAPGGSPAGPGGALVIIQRAPAAPGRPGPDLLSEAATRIGTTLDLTRTAREVAARLAGQPPEDILHRLDRMAAGMPAAPFATCIYPVIDPERNSCVIAKAGHPPPLLGRPGRAPQVLDLPPRLPRAALGPALSPPGAPLDTGPEMVTQALRQRGDDDITLVLARIRPGASGSR